jgi:hypothetical protein
MLNYDAEQVFQLSRASAHNVRLTTCTCPWVPLATTLQQTVSISGCKTQLKGANISLNPYRVTCHAGRFDFWLNIGTSTPGGAVSTSIMQLLIQPLAAAAVVASRG